MIKWLTINGMVETFCLQFFKRSELFTRIYHFFVKLSVPKFFLAKQTHILKRRNPYKPTRKSIKLYKKGSVKRYRKK